MNAIKNKIGSREGASISFALLAFLVCAVISSVVIVAGSTAAGRMSQIAQSDQRYYAVNSAAGLLQSTLDGQTVRVEKTTKTETKYKADGTLFDPQPAQISPVTKYFCDTTDVTERDHYSLLSDLAKAMPLDGASEKTVLINAQKMSLSATSEDADMNAALAVDLYETADSDGTLVLYVSKVMKKQDGTEIPNAAYTLRLTFAADIKTNTVSNTVRGTPSETDGSYTDTTTETRTTEIKWTMIDIVKSTVPQST